MDGPSPPAGTETPPRTPASLPYDDDGFAIPRSDIFKDETTAAEAAENEAEDPKVFGGLTYKYGVARYHESGRASRYVIVPKEETNHVRAVCIAAMMMGLRQPGCVTRLLGDGETTFYDWSHHASKVTRSMDHVQEDGRGEQKKKHNADKANAGQGQAADDVGPKGYAKVKGEEQAPPSAPPSSGNGEETGEGDGSTTNWKFCRHVLPVYRALDASMKESGGWFLSDLGRGPAQQALTAALTAYGVDSCEWVATGYYQQLKGLGDTLLSSSFTADGLDAVDWKAAYSAPTAVASQKQMFPSTFGTKEEVESRIEGLRKLSQDGTDALSSMPCPWVSHMILFTDEGVLQPMRAFERVMASMHTPHVVCIANGDAKDLQALVQLLVKGARVLSLKGTGGAAEYLSGKIDGSDSPQAADELGFLLERGGNEMNMSNAYSVDVLSETITRQQNVDASGDKEKKHAEKKSNKVKPGDFGGMLESMVADTLWQVHSPDERNLGYQDSEVQRLVVAWKIFLHLHSLERRFAKYARRLFYLIAYASLFTTLASIFSTTEASGDANSHPSGMTTFIVLLSVFHTGLLAFQSRSKPIVKWATLLQAKLELQSEIYRYRMKVGPYASNAKVTTWLSVVQDDISEEDKGYRNNRLAFDFEEQEKKEKDEKMNARSLFQQNLLRIASRLESVGFENVAIASNVEQMVGGQQALAEEVVAKLKQGLPGLDPRDDFLSNMSAEAYVTYRIAPLSSYYHSELRIKSRWNSALKILSYAATASGSLISLYDGSVWVAATVALAATFHAFRDFNQYDVLVESLQQSLTVLQELVVWYKSRSLVEKRTQEVREELVKHGELCVEADISAWLGSVRNFVRNFLATRQNVNNGSGVDKEGEVGFGTSSRPSTVGDSFRKDK